MLHPQSIGAIHGGRFEALDVALAARTPRRSHQRRRSRCVVRPLAASPRTPSRIPAVPGAHLASGRGPQTRSHCSGARNSGGVDLDRQRLLGFDFPVFRIASQRRLIIDPFMGEYRHRSKRPRLPIATFPLHRSTAFGRHRPFHRRCEHSQAERGPIVNPATPPEPVAAAEAVRFRRDPAFAQSWWTKPTSTTRARTNRSSARPACARTSSCSSPCPRYTRSAACALATWWRIQPPCARSLRGRRHGP